MEARPSRPSNKSGIFFWMHILTTWSPYHLVQQFPKWNENSRNLSHLNADFQRGAHLQVEVQSCSFQNEKCQKSFCSNANGRRDSRSKLVYIWWKPAGRCKVSPSFHKSCAFQIGIVHREKEKTNSRRKQGEFSFKFKYFARHVNSPNPTKTKFATIFFPTLVFWCHAVSYTYPS